MDNEFKEKFWNAVDDNCKNKDKEYKHFLAPGSDSWIEFVNTYQPASDEQLKQYAAINEASKNFMRVIFDNTPKCADQSAAIRLLREVRMTANAAIALQGLI